MRKQLYCLFALLIMNSVFMGCKKELSAIPNSLLPTETIFTDRNLVIATLAQFYASTNYGQQNGDFNQFDGVTDESIANDGSPFIGDASFDRNKYRVIDYALLRRMNQFLEGIRSDAAKKALVAADRTNFEAQCLFLRAWYYFYMTRTLGGMTIVGDKIFTYDSGMDETPFQLPRNTEADCFQYVMDQCDTAAARFTTAATIGKSASFGTAATVNAAFANKWAALMLKARTAITAASLAKYNNLITPDYVTPNGEVGIPANKAPGYYAIALATAKTVISTSPYVLQTSSTNPEQAFYNATSVKTGNTEVIWALDRKSPDVVTQFTTNVMPYSHRDQATGNKIGATLNLVEAFENRNGSNPVIATKNGSNYVFYNDVEDPFKAKDARLWGTVIWPNALYRGTPVPLQAGQLTKATIPYTLKTGNPGATDGITSINGPASTTATNLNKTGFGVRKFLDETVAAGLQPNYSAMWMPRFRISEAYLIAAEAAFETNDLPTAVTNINAVRARGLIQPLTTATISFAKIVNENRVEFAFEDHRLWDVKRWRIAHTLWNNISDDPFLQPTSASQPYSLYAYKVVATGDPNNGKWIFERAKAYRRATTPLKFDPIAYNAALDLNWISPNNPAWVKNPKQ